jgi:hypothetical protein
MQTLDFDIIVLGQACVYYELHEVRRSLLLTSVHHRQSVNSVRCFICKLSILGFSWHSIGLTVDNLVIYVPLVVALCVWI